MKKLLFVLACTAGLGLWISCSNEAQDVNLKLDTGLIEKSYKNYGVATATKVTMVTHKGAAVTYDEKSDEPNNKPTDGKDWYIDSECEYNKEKDDCNWKYYWFYNDWDSGTSVTFDDSCISWSDGVSYYPDGVVGKESVSNEKEYGFYFGLKDDETSQALHNEYKVCAGSNYVKLKYLSYYDVERGRYIVEDFNTASLTLDGSLEGNFTINGSMKPRDWCYGEIDADIYQPNYWHRRLDERTEYEPTWEKVWNDEGIGECDWEEGRYFEWEFSGYEPVKIPANTSVYYLTNVSFTKN